LNRDLKPENIIYESKKEGSQLKVIDFGTSRYFDPLTAMKQKFGTVKKYFFFLLIKDSHTISHQKS